LLADKNLLASAGLKIGDNMKFDIAGRTIQYAKIEKIVQKSDKYLIVLSTASTIIEAKDLLNTLRNSSMVYYSSQRTCVALN
jgi:predicted lysophospholipase L1 biosynthesis ABC-type transport system permease subunit